MSKDAPPKSEEIRSEVVNADFKEKKIVHRMDVEPDSSVVAFLNTWKKFCKDEKVKSVFILTIDENNHITWGFQPDNEHHQALACLTLEDLREEIKASIFGEWLDDE